MKKKVVIGMSGGVDSSVAAIMLQKQGYEVIGLFMRNWDSTINNDFLGNPNLNESICPTTDEGICPQEVDYNDAKKVCDKLGIPLYRKDFIKEYWDYVFTYFLDELKNKDYENVLIVAHSGVSKAFSGYFEGIQDGKFLNRGLKNCEIKMYEL